jgi:DNA end-binding protein Ku
MKAIWTGSLSFGLVNIPINLYSAISEHRFGFKTLCGKCHNPISYIRWCEHCKKNIEWNSVVKGFQKRNNNFFVLTKDALKKLRPEKDDILTIKEFISQADIDLLYTNNHYYMRPKKENDKAFYLFLEALKKSKRVAIGQFVMHEKEHLAMINSYHDVLLLNTLHYEYEIRTLDIKDRKKIAKPTKQELDLALELIDKLTHKKFALSMYKDTYVEKLKKVLKTVESGQKIRIRTEKKRSPAKKSILNSLRASLQEELRRH